MPLASYPLTTLRGALQGLVHELYFKCTHFPSLRGQSDRPLHDIDHARFEVTPEDDLLDEADPFTALLTERVKGLAILPADTTRAQLLDVWERAESTLNARMRAIFGLLGPQLPYPVVTMLCGDAAIVTELRLSPGRNPVGGERADRFFGQPDIVLLGGSSSVSIEMKVRGGTARATYDAHQHFQYLRLAEELARVREVRQSYHVLLAPFGHSRVIRNSRRWLDAPEGHAVPLVTDSPRLFAELGERARSTILGLGGTPWLDALLDRLPSRCVDLGALLDVVSACGTPYPELETRFRHEIEMVRHFGLPTRK